MSKILHLLSTALSARPNLSGLDLISTELAYLHLAFLCQLFEG